MHGGSGAPQTTWDYFEGRARPNYQNVIQSSVNSAGTHNHPIGNAPAHTHTARASGGHGHTMNTTGNHSHTIGNNGGHAHTSANVGGNQALPSLSPGITMNVEIKL